MFHSPVNQSFRRSLRAVALVLALFAVDADAVIAVDNVSTVVDNNPTTLSVSHTTGAGADRLMIVGVSLLNNDLETVNSVTYNGIGLTFVGEATQSNDSRVEIWSLLNPPPTTANVVVTFNEQVQLGAGVGVITFTGVNQVSPYGLFQSNTGESSTASAIVIASAGETIIGVMAAERQDSNPVVVGGTEQWSFKTQPGVNRTAGAGATFPGSASVNLTWNLNEIDDWAIGAIALRDASVATVTLPGFCDDFESGLANWIVNTSGGGSAGINSDTFNSGANSLFTRWGQVNVTNSTAIDANGKPFQLSLWIRRGDDSFSEDPDGVENLQIQYLNGLNSWVTLETFAGSGVPGQIFERNYALPVDAQHAGLRVRIVQTSGSGADFDYWHVDDVCVLEVVQPEIELRMDEVQWNGSANEVVDSSGNGNDANANLASGLTTINPGQICRAGDFDGVDDYIESNDIFSYLRTTASLSFWIRTTQTGDDIGWRAPGVTGVEEAGGSDDIFWGWLDASGRIGISVGNDYATKSAIAINDGSYHHVVLTRDSTTGDYKIYIDGALDASGTSIAGIIGNSFSSIGRIEDTGGTPEYFQGELDELLVFNSVLSDSAVTSIFTNQSLGRNLDGSTRSCADSLAWFQLDADAGVWNGSAGEVVDQSGNFTGAFALGTGAGVDSVLARVCRGITVPFNNSNGAQYGFDSGIDIDNDVGNLGSINFWYNSNANWVGGGNRMLADASPNDLPGADKYFYLTLRNNGRLRFALEDSADGDYSFQTGVNNINAGVWTHIAVTWNMSGNREIYINGALAATHTTATNGQIGNLRTLYFGDNRSNYHPGGTANSANGIIDEVRVYDKVQTVGEIIADMNATHPCGTSMIDHFSITPATTAASTCLPNAVTIIAEDASNNPVTTYTNQVNISVSTGNGNWSVNNADNVTSPNPDNDDDGAVSYTYLLSDAGEIVLDLTNTHAETLTITVVDPIDGVTSTSVVIVYASNLFVITEDPIQVAGRPMAMNVEMWTDDLLGSATCGIDTTYNYAAIILDASIDRGGVLLAANDPNIGVVTVPNVPASAAITFDFSVTPGQASFNLDSSDVGQYSLTLVDNTNTHSDAIIAGTSTILTVRPFGIAVTTIEAGPGPTPNLGGTAPGDAIFTTAGSNFAATVSGVLWSAADDLDNNGVLDSGAYANNSVAPSFAWNTTLSVSAAVASYTPSPGMPGVLNNGNILQGEFSGGFFNVTDLQYTEVGSFTLQSAADNYLGEPGADIVGDDIIVGRFIPASFEVTINGDGVFAETCAAFTYIGEAFSYAIAPTITVTAKNALGGTTAQYRDAFVKLDGGSVSVAASQDDTTPGSDTLPLLVDYSPAAAMIFSVNNDGTVDYTFGADIYRYGPGAPLAFSKYANSQVAPFVADINPEIGSVGDGEVATSFAPLTHVLGPTGNNQRFGRLRMENVHGSEINSLLMPVFTEFWDGSSFQKNILDSCTLIANSDLIAVGSPPGLSVPVVVNAPASVGDVNLSFPAPGAGNDGFIDTTTDLNAALHLWLRFDWDADGEFDDDPVARATFGIFDGDPVQIYIQQIYE